MNEKKKILVEAKSILSDPQHWTKGSWARDRSGNICNEKSPDAFCFCLFGAVTRAGYNLNLYGYRGYVRDTFENAVGQQFITFNDNPDTTFEMIHEALDKAIAACGDEA